MAYNTITLKTRGAPLLKEAQAAAALSPGYLLYRTSANKFAKHATAGQKVMPLFALENEATGADLTTAYATNDTVQAAVFETGEEVYAKLAAAAPAIVVGDYLESAGDGTLRKVLGLTDSSGGTANTTLQAIGGSYTQAEVANNFADLAAYANLTKPTAVAIALEAVDNSGGSDEVFIRVEIL